MTVKNTCARCNCFITKNEAGEWEDDSGVMSDWCRYGKPGHEDIRHAPAAEKCSYCKKPIVHVEGILWHSDDPILQQYCYADMVGGSRLHTPEK